MNDNHECPLNRDMRPMTLTPGVFELVAPYQPAGDFGGQQDGRDDRGNAKALPQYPSVRHRGFGDVKHIRRLAGYRSLRHGATL